ncbi:MAG TPA: diaminopimelate decarboxylase [Armatimonadota bacterium]|nr:diaminopimelate decarboxylase [Armatimonadota bacterium]
MMRFGTQTVNSKGHLEIGGCDAVELAERFGTPLYVMDEKLIRQNCRDYLNGFRSRYARTDIAFAGKAFLTAATCRIMDQEGLGLDVVSAGEVYTALKADFPMDRLYFHGNYKSEAEIRMALDKGVGRIVVDSVYELEVLNSLALETGRKADILLRLTPGIDPHTHRLIRLGQADTKFGLNVKDGSAMSAVKRALELPGISLRGIHCHIGSQLLDTQAHTAAVQIMVEFARQVLDETGLAIEEINTGGGLGIRYFEGQQPPTIDQFAADVTGAFIQSLKEFALPHQPKLVQEPGRSIVGTAGTTLYTVGPIKRVPITEEPEYRVYVAVDGGLSDNPRPLLYDAVYQALVANKADGEPSQVVTISGKHCEADTLIQDARIAEVAPGDILAVYCTGAYNYSMASNYNRLPRPAAVLVADGEADVIVERETLDDLVRHDVIPARLNR